MRGGRQLRFWAGSACPHACNARCAGQLSQTSLPAQRCPQFPAPGPPLKMWKKLFRQEGTISSGTVQVEKEGSCRYGAASRAAAGRSGSASMRRFLSGSCVRGGRHASSWLCACCSLKGAARRQRLQLRLGAGGEQDCNCCPPAQSSAAVGLAAGNRPPRQRHLRCCSCWHWWWWCARDTRKSAVVVAVRAAVGWNWRVVGQPGSRQAASAGCTACAATPGHPQPLQFPAHPHL